MLTFLHQVKRLCYRLVCWINYPTPRERLWGFYVMGKIQGKHEALKDLPITQVQPRQETEPRKVHLPPGMLTRQWRETHLTKYGVTPAELAKVPTAHDLTETIRTTRQLDPNETERMPAIVNLLHQGHK